MHRPLLLATFAILFAATASAAGAQEPETSECGQPRIAHVEVVREALFSEREGVFGWFSRTGNRLHIDTRERVIRRELLFAEGQPLDVSLLAQSERNLRAQHYLADVRVEVIMLEGEPLGAAQLETTDHCWDPATETVTVRVTTRDSWSTSLEGKLRKAGDRWFWGLGIDESNLLGLGKQVGFGYETDVDRNSFSVGYRDTRVLGSANQLVMQYRDQSDGASFRLVAGRPYYSLDDHWSYEARLETFDQRQPLYAAGEQINSLRTLRRHQAVTGSARIHRGGRAATRFHFGVRNEFDDVEVEIRDYTIVQAGLSTVQHRFRNLRWVNHDRPTDVNLGYDSSVLVGYAARQDSTRPGTTWFLNARHSHGAALGSRRFVLGSASWGSRIRTGIVENGMLDARLLLLDHGAARRAWLVSARLNWGVRLDPEVQIRMGVDTGLRGYPVNQFVGDRSLLLSAEYRWFLIDDLFGAVALGVAGFVDSGYAWPRGQPVALADLRSDVGVSLLLARRQVSIRNAGTRIDLAYALDPVIGRSRWVFSFGTTRDLGS